MASAANPTGAMDEVIQRERRNVELLISLRDILGEYQENQEVIHNRLQNLPLGLGRPLSIPSVPSTTSTTSTPVSPMRATNGHSKDKPAEPAPVQAPSVRGSKTEFVTACFRREPKMNPKEINDLWVKNGGDGQISPSLVYKTKHDMNKAARGGGRRVAAAARKNVRIASGTAVADGPDISEMKEVIWKILSKRPMSTGELLTEIEDGEYFDPMPRDADDLIKTTVNELRGANKVFRGDNRRYSIVQGATLED